MYYRIFSKSYEGAAKKMCLVCRDFIEKGSTILDLGCGSAIVGNKFKEFFQAEVIGVDIIDRRVKSLPFEIIDGKNLPFPEKSFDVVLIAYVLHHTDASLSLLKEAKRVSRDKVIIFEDLSEGFLPKLLCKFHGISYGKFFRSPNLPGSRAKPRTRAKLGSGQSRTELRSSAGLTTGHSISFKSEKEWKKVFEEIGLKIIFKKRIHSFPVKKELFVLGV